MSEIQRPKSESNEPKLAQQLICYAMGLDDFTIPISDGEGKALSAVIREKRKQRKKQGESGHSARVFALAHAVEYGQLCQAIYQYHYEFRASSGEKIRDKAVKVCASALALIEHIDAGKV